jgi:phage host-nuclease inhibitor protein Gam
VPFLPEVVQTGSTLLPYCEVKRKSLTASGHLKLVSISTTYVKTHRAMETSVVVDLWRETLQAVLDNFIGLAVASPLFSFAYFFLIYKHN